MLQGEHRVFLMQKIGSGDDDAVEMLLFDHLPVVGIDVRSVVELFLLPLEKALTPLRIDIRSGDYGETLLRQMGIIRDVPSAGCSDDSDSQHIHGETLQCEIWFCA